jgi:hypothetical protein
VRPHGDHAFEIDTGAGRVLLEMDARLSVTLARGCEEPIAGWVSRRYHEKTPAVTLIGRGDWEGSESYVHRITVMP